MALYSSSWYNVRVRDELEFVESRCNNLSDELHTVQTDMARAEQRRAKKQEYADNLLSEARRVAQDVADEKLAELRSRPKKQ